MTYVRRNVAVASRRAELRIVYPSMFEKSLQCNGFFRVLRACGVLHFATARGDCTPVPANLPPQFPFAPNFCPSFRTIL
jgi:hypothetical protein